MKTLKLILIAFTIILAGALVHDAYASPVDSLQTESIPTLEQIPGQMYNDVKDALKEIAAGLGTTVEYVWPVFVQQQVVNGVIALTYIVLNLLAFTVAFIMFISSRRAEVKERRYDWGENVVASFITSMAFLLLFLFVIGCNLDTAMTGIFNPEYAAVKEVIELIK